MSNTSSGWRLRPDQTGILLDRCLEHRLESELAKIPLIRAVGLADMYGAAAAPSLPDTAFLADAGNHGWQVWTQNFKMWRVDDERQAIIDNGTHVFSLASAQLLPVGKAFVFGRWWTSMNRRSRRPGPCFWRLHANRIQRDQA